MCGVSDLGSMPVEQSATRLTALKKAFVEVRVSTYRTLLLYHAGDRKIGTP